jgi:hypothetical protein
MSFTGSEGEEISLSDASAWTENHRNSHSGIHGHYFGRQHIEAILDQSGCVGIRIYHGIDDNNKACLILVGVDANENDLYNGYIAERGVSCPPYCGSGSPLAG